MMDTEDPQEVVSYCESRFRAMLNAFQDADDEKQGWISTGLNAEMVITMHNYSK
jgi:hypothetical protein